MKTFYKLIALLLFSISSLLSNAFAFDETVYIFRSFDDPDVPANPDVCRNGSFYDENFPAYVVLGASLWSLQSKASNAEVNNEAVRQIGVGDFCAKVTDLSPGAVAPVYLDFTLEVIVVRGEGSCVVTSNTIPQNGIVLVGCSIQVEGNPDTGLAGGVATSNSVFNPFNLPDFQTGSFWTIHVYHEE